MRKVVGYIVLFLLLSIIPIFNVSAGRGCCSHHGGQAYCSNGRWICNDGTVSPTCTCSGGSSSSNSSSSSSSSNNSYNNVTTRKTTTTRKITTTTKKQVYGCMDSSAINYNVDATNKDGSCQYEKTKIKTEDINYNTKIKGNLKEGDKTVIEEGQKGQKEVTIKRIVDEDGNEISSEVVSEKIIKDPVDEVVKYEEEMSDGEAFTILIIYVFIIILVMFYSKKNRNSKLIINYVKKIKIRIIRYIIYIIYFVYIIPIFIDAILVIIDFVKRKLKK